MKRISTLVFLCLMAWGIGWCLGAYFPNKQPPQAEYAQTSKANHQTQKNIVANAKNEPLETQPTGSKAATPAKSNDNAEILPRKNSPAAVTDNELVTINSPSQLASMAQIDPKVNDVVSLPKKFASESINYEWALPREKKLKEIFHLDPAFQARQVMDVVCKSSVCEIKIAVEDTKQLSAIGSDIMRLISRENSVAFAQDLMITYSQPDETGSFFIQGADQ